MTVNTIAYVFELLLLLGTAAGIYALLLPSQRQLLDELVQLPAATTFYLRSFALILVLVALDKAFYPVDLKSGAHFMEYLWFAAGVLADVLEHWYVMLVVYLGLITILTAVLRRRHAQ
jgi:hypothetical protein